MSTPISPPHRKGCWFSRNGNWPLLLTETYKLPAQRDSYVYAVTCADCGGYRAFRIRRDQPPESIDGGVRVLAWPSDMSLQGAITA